MSTESKGVAHPQPKRARERTVSDVAKEAFQSRVAEGDRPIKPRSSKIKVQPSV